MDDLELPQWVVHRGRLSRSSIQGESVVKLTVQVNISSISKWDCELVFDANSFKSDNDRVEFGSKEDGMFGIAYPHDANNILVYFFTIHQVHYAHTGSLRISPVGVTLTSSSSSLGENTIDTEELSGLDDPRLGVLAVIDLVNRYCGRDHYMKPLSMLHSGITKYCKAV
jgi:hypothetical protein